MNALSPLSEAGPRPLPEHKIKAVLRALFGMSRVRQKLTIVDFAGDGVGILTHEEADMLIDALGLQEV